MNMNIDGKTKQKKIFMFAGYPWETEDFLRVNHISPEDFQISFSSTIICRVNSQKSLTEVGVPLKLHIVLDMFVDCLGSLPKQTRVK